MHRPVCLLIGLRVGRNSSIFPPSLGLGFRVAPYFRSLFAEPASDSVELPPRPRAFGCAGDGPFEFPRSSHAFGVAGFSEVPGFPGGSRLLLPRLRYRSPVSLLPVPPALPAMDRRVASIHASFGGAGCESSSLRLRFAPPVSPTISIRVAPNAHPPAPADHGPSLLGESCHPVRLGGTSGLLRVFSLGFVVQQVSKSPWILCCSTSPIRFVSSCPETLFLG